MWNERISVKVKVEFLNGHTSELVTNTNKIIEIIDFYPDVTPPSSPKNLLASSTSGHTDLVWEKNNESDLSFYGIYRSLDSTIAISNQLSTTSDTTYIDTTAEYGIKYYYSISAVESAGNESEFSDIISFMIVDSIPPC